MRVQSWLTPTRPEPTISHAVLLGDSIFDNAAYVPGRPDVVRQLARARPAWCVTLLAVDGSVTSSGGNDALGVQPLLTRPARSVIDALSALPGGWRISASPTTG